MDNTTLTIILLCMTAISAIIIVLSYINISSAKSRIVQLQALLESKINSDSSEKLALRQDLSEESHRTREEIASNFKLLSDLLLNQLKELSSVQTEKLGQLSSDMKTLLEKNVLHQEKIDQTVKQSLKEIQLSNEQKLEAMRLVVDEKLNTTLTKRLDDSFKNVSEQLQQLYKSLGEMQNLSNGVQSLNRILTNVKTRGTWGEVQLGSLLSEIMSPEQYEQNVAVKRGSKERVDFAIRLPGMDGDDQPVWLPIDAKFTQEDYLRLLDASEKADSDAVVAALRALDAKVKFDARSIRDKYLNPPVTTDFAIMFLPTEGLYAEVLRIDGLSEYCQRECRIMLAGPTTLAALLNSLRVGFATLAIEKKSSEVWKTLGAIKKQYSTFNNLLDKSLQKLDDARASMTNAQDRAKIIYTKLNKVQEIDDADSDSALELPEYREE